MNKPDSTYVLIQRELQATLACLDKAESDPGFLVTARIHVRNATSLLHMVDHFSLPSDPNAAGRVADVSGPQTSVYTLADKYKSRSEQRAGIATLFTIFFFLIGVAAVVALIFAIAYFGTHGL